MEEVESSYGEMFIICYIQYGAKHLAFAAL